MKRTPAQEALHRLLAAIIVIAVAILIGSLWSQHQRKHLSDAYLQSCLKFSKGADEDHYCYQQHGLTN